MYVDANNNSRSVKAYVANAELFTGITIMGENPSFDYKDGPDIILSCCRFIEGQEDEYNRILKDYFVGIKSGLFMNIVGATSTDNMGEYCPFN